MKEGLGGVRTRRTRPRVDDSIKTSTTFVFRVLARERGGRWGGQMKGWLVVKDGKGLGRYQENVWLVNRVSSIGFSDVLLRASEFRFTSQAGEKGVGLWG